MRRLLPSLVAVLAIIVAACSSGGATTAPSAAGGAVGRPLGRPISRALGGAVGRPLGRPIRRPLGRPLGGAVRGRRPALEGELTVWHSYGSGAGTELAAFTQNLDRIKAANPGLTVTVTEVPFDQLFNKINTGVGRGRDDPRHVHRPQRQPRLPGA